jgi:hypothetical protein
VFNDFYEVIMGVPFGGLANIPISRLLGYISDCRWENGTFRYEATRSAAVTFAITKYAAETDFRATLALQMVDQMSNAALQRILMRDFEQVSLINVSADKVFSMAAEVARAHTFWRSKRVFPLTAQGGVPIGDIGNHVRVALQGKISDVIYQEATTFYLNRAFVRTNTTPMNEFVAIYVLMFFLGSLVRYRPSVLEGMLEKEDAWMVESLMRSVPVAFLRHARNALSGECCVYVGR